MARDLIREHLSYLRVEKGLAPNSIAAYEDDLTRMANWAAKNGFELTALTRRDLREWLIDLGKEKLSENSRRRMISALRGFYRFLALEGHIPSNPAEDLDVPQKGSYLPRFLTVPEVEALFARPDVATEVGIRDRAILELMYACGLRATEVTTLRPQDIDIAAGILTTKGKGGKTRKVPVGSSALEWVTRYMRSRTDDDGVKQLFVSGPGRPVTRQMIYSLIKRYSEAAKLAGVTPHTLRHSFATHLVQNRADIRSVQQMLGHADISTTQIYTHITDSHLRESYDRFHPRARSGGKSGDPDDQSDKPAV